MYADKKKMWIDDLRANADKQGTGYLTTTGGDCCLGRLCKLALANGVEMKIDSHDSIVKGIITTYDGASAFLPQRVRDWSGLWDVDPFLENPTHDRLVSVNDSGKTFPEIADLIEKFIPETQPANA